MWGSNHEDALLVMWLQGCGPSVQRAYFLEECTEYINYSSHIFDTAKAQAALAGNSSATLLVLHIKDLAEMMFVVRTLWAHVLDTCGRVLHSNSSVGATAGV